MNPSEIVIPFAIYNEEKAVLFVYDYEKSNIPYYVGFIDLNLIPLAENEEESFLVENMKSIPSIYNKEIANFFINNDQTLTNFPLEYKEHFVRFIEMILKTFHYETFRRLKINSRNKK